MSVQDLAPICLFTYNRIENLKKTIKALKNNYLAKKSNLFIFSDGPKNNIETNKIYKLRDFIKTISGFKNIILIENKNNFGLKKNIIKGINYVLRDNEKIIVLEDDLVTTKNFLFYMNKALNFYSKKKRVMQISSFALPFNNCKNNFFFWKHSFCWGWGTWKDRWKYYNSEPDNYINNFTKEEIKDFDFNGSNFLWPQILANKKKKINTWAIFWSATIYKKNGLCLNPTKSFIKNIGYDKNATHSYKSKIKVNLINEEKRYFKFPDKIFEDLTNYSKMEDFIKKNKINIFLRMFNLFTYLIFRKRFFYSKF